MSGIARKLMSAAGAKDEPITEGDLIVGQTQADYNGVDGNGTIGPLGPMTGHAVSDVITLSNGAEVRVDGIFGPGRPVAFTIVGTAFAIVGVELTQTSTTGSGTNFSITPGPNNVE